jgi:hypothetical protein
VPDGLPVVFDEAYREFVIAPDYPDVAGRGRRWSGALGVVLGSAVTVAATADTSSSTNESGGLQKSAQVERANWMEV